MYELIQVGEKTYYIDCPAKIGVYRLNETEVCLIDSGNDKDAGKKILKLLESHGWTLKMILNTHSHADHIGGNRLLQQRTGCPAYMAGVDLALGQYPVLEPSFLYGGYPCKALRNKFLCAPASEVRELTLDVLPTGMRMLRLDGHSFSMSAFWTDDDVWFLADSLTSEHILQKYHVPFVYDVAAYCESLHTVGSLQGKLFVPSHAPAVEDVRPFVQKNLEQVGELEQLLLSLCRQPVGFDDILAAVFSQYSLTMDLNQHALVGSTVRSYLAWLQERGELHASICNNRLCWKTEQMA